MAIFNNIDEALHRIRVKLYPNYLSKVAITFEQVCAARKNWSGFTGSYDVYHVKQFFDEAAYQRCDGFAVNAGRLR